MEEAPGPRLLSDAELEASAVVANCAMNRRRGLAGVNSYARELGFDPLAVLLARAATGPAAWLDLCCGSGRALVEAADRLGEARPAHPVALVGVDLVDAFDGDDVPPSQTSPDAGPHPPPATGAGPTLDLVCAPVTAWTPDRSFDLVTCVHGLHYVGDKLGLLACAAGWLADGGQLVADLDLADIRLVDGRDARRALPRRLRGAGFDWDPRRHRVSRTGPASVAFGYRYLGADDRAGPNYTGQSAVGSHYVDEACTDAVGIETGRPG